MKRYVAPDTAFQDVLIAVKDVNWNSFQPDDACHEWYYAENQLYVIHDVMMDCYYFIKARNPYIALEQVRERTEEVKIAGNAQTDNIVRSV